MGHVVNLRMVLVSYFQIPQAYHRRRSYSAFAEVFAGVAAGLSALVADPESFFAGAAELSLADPELPAESFDEFSDFSVFLGVDFSDRESVL